MGTNTQRFLNNATTTAAGLRFVSLAHRDNCDSGLDSLVVEKFTEHPQAHVVRYACEARFAHRHLAKSIGDVGWSAFVGMLAYKGDGYGCQVEKVSRWYPSSKTCSACGAVMEAMPLHVHEWQCPVCDLVHDRDVNAAALATA